MPRTRRQWITPARAKPLGRFLRIGAFTVLGITALTLILVLIHRGLLPVVAWLFPSLQKPFYDLAVYGAYPTREFVSFGLNAPTPSRVLWDESCDGGFILVGPNGPSVPQSGPMILDTNGELVWMSHDYDSIMNFNVQLYKGEQYLTFWAGNKQGSTGKGDMLMLDSNYKVAYRIRAVGEGNKGDLHEFRLTDEGTALITVFNNTQADLRKMSGFRGADGWVTDGMFQEVDIETNELLFEWRAIDHFKPEDTNYFDPFGGYSESHPFDYYHLNSIEKDSKGNYLISSRHFHSVSYIDGKTGDVLWVLGGGSKDFTDLSDGLCTEHQWQHNARWIDEEKGILSFMDNGVAGPLHVDAPYSKGTIVQLHLDDMTVTHVQSYVSKDKVRSASQGNLQVLDNGNILVGWGATAAYSEFLNDGTLLCEVHYAASWTFWWERWKSYRVYRIQGWVGSPEYPPTAQIKGDHLYISWNGATEVRYWELQAARASAEGDSAFESIDIIEKTTFESSFILPSEGDYVRYRVAAMDGEKKILHHSDPVEPDGGSGSVVGVILGICAGIGSAVGVWYLVRTWARRRRVGKKLFTWEPTELFTRERYQYSKL
ncbi:hypothetical protein LTR37_001244 [Vermiconidia calcicola]|uniref:Uncharacterized protein n=1 Tax=Vermiconidia calcicola TaxID=1690605 RepID=A0ACC3NVW4_9PEZI|nr:hypothetical protein LTR37_001244 [Vermiconidia calcicola]